MASDTSTGSSHSVVEIGAVDATAMDGTTDPIETHRGDFQLAIDDIHDQVDALAFSHVDSPSRFRDRDLRIHVVDRRYKYPTWMHPNLGGEARHLNGPTRESIAGDTKPPTAKLSEWMSTAISGNDILSSVLFTTGLTLIQAGKLAPFANLIAAAVLYCLRGVLAEVMSAVPLNGGCYSAILNASTKRTASVSAVLSIISYLATGVVCAVAACSYINTLVEIPILASAIGMLFFFAVLCLFGIAESAAVALGFFVIHVLTLSLLCITCIVYAIIHPDIFRYNLDTPIPKLETWGSHVAVGNVATALFYGYGTAMIGMTGFEASAQYIEQQAAGVFPKTLRNMWVSASFYNIAFSVLSLAVIKLDDPELLTHNETLLAVMGRITGGRWLEIIVSVDAFIVLAGAVLTSYVGIAGLLNRLSIDRILPRLFTRTNQWRGSPHYTILLYFAVASSLVVAMDGDMAGLSGVFAFAFLGVLGSFIVACVLLKIHREVIPRSATTSWINCFFCLIMVLIGALANALGDSRTFGYFFLYVSVVGAVVVIMLERVWMLKALLDTTRRMLKWWHRRQSKKTDDVIGSLAIAKRIEKIKRTPAVFFCKTPNLPKINEAIAYVMRNEQTYSLQVVHVCAFDAPEPREFEDIVCLFDHIYPSLKVDFVSVRGDAFDENMVEWLVNRLHVPTNMMFMREPSTPAMHAVASVGVRVITS